MGLSRLAEQCRKCPFKDNCKNKRMEALGYLPEPIVAEAGASSAAELTQPILRETVNTMIDLLNFYRVDYNHPEIDGLPENKKFYWWQMIQLLPSSYNQKRTVMLNYEVLANIHKSRRNHKLDEWHTFCDWIEELPYSEIITGYEEEKNE